MLDVGTELLARKSAANKEALKEIALADAGHTTPKLGVRGAVFDEHGRILLVQERSDGQWTLPGGWADVLESAGEAVRREIREEAGLETETVKLAAVLDRERQDNQPPMSAHIYTLFFLSRKTGETPRHDSEILNVDWYELDALPPLSTSRVTESQLRLMHAHHQDPKRPPRSTDTGRSTRLHSWMTKTPGRFGRKELHRPPGAVPHTAHPQWCRVRLGFPNFTGDDAGCCFDVAYEPV